MTQKEEWFIANSIKGGNEIITRSRKDLKPVMESKKYNIRIEISWHYSGDEKGMPDLEIQDLMDKMEEVLTLKIEKKEIAYQSAIFMGNSKGIWVWYAKDAKLFGEELNNCLNYFPTLPLEIISTNDPKWTDYIDTIKLCGMNL